MFYNFISILQTCSYGLYMGYITMQFSPWIKVGNRFKRLWVGQQFVQHVDNVHKAWTLGAVVKPALKH